MRTGIREGRQSPRMLEDTQHIRRRLVYEGLDENAVVVFKAQIDDGLDRMFAALLCQIGD